MLKEYLLVIVTSATTVHSNTNEVGSDRHRITRIDNLSLDPLSNVKTAQYIYDAKLSLETINKAILSPSQAFQIDLSCEVYGVAPEVCLKAKQTIQNAGELIAQVLLITSPIRVNARFRPFCNSGNDCEAGKRLASAKHSSVFVAKDKGKYFTLNQALVKQLKTDIKPTFSQFDILADFNSNVDWLFSGETDNGKTDLEFVAAHGITFNRIDAWPRIW